MSSTFADLGVPSDLAGRLAERGIIHPFPIQAATLPPALAGRDVCGRAPTGSGKTLAFGLPLVLRVGRAQPGRPQALVLAPTRELAAQIHQELAPLATVRKRRVASFYGGVGFGPQLAALRRGVDIVVACPGRLTDLVNRGAVDLSAVNLVVLDEADRMADMGFLPDVRRLLDQVKPDRQTLLFSATLDGDVDVVIRRYQDNPSRHEVAPPHHAADLTLHFFWRAAREQRLGLTVKVIEQGVSTLVFCRTKRGADRLARQLGQAGVSAAAIHGDRSQAQRERALAAFSTRRVRALVATDVAARGIHVDGVDCVVHFDLPADEKDYLHRSGRTGRAGAMGTVVSFVGDEHVAGLRQLQRKLGLAAGSQEPDLAGLAGRRPAPDPSRSVASSRARTRENVTERSRGAARKAWPRTSGGSSQPDGGGRRRARRPAR